MLKQYGLKLPHAVYGGENAIDHITSIIKEHGYQHVAMFTDKSIQGLGLFDIPRKAVEAAGVSYDVFNELPPEPAYMQVQSVIDQFKSCNADFIIACGGGSVMDAAKLASILITDEYGVKELLDRPGMAKKCVPVLLIPTTAGTGAEVTPNAIVAVPEKELKVGIVNDGMIADYVILDARMIKNLPRSIAAATGVDALAHAIECYTSKMQIAAFYAGIAITASGTTAVHALSYPLGGKYHIAHGVSNAILLAPVMRFNEPACRDKFAEAYDRCCHETKRCAATEEKSAWLIKRLEEIVKHLDDQASCQQYAGGNPGRCEKDL